MLVTKCLFTVLLIERPYLTKRGVTIALASDRGPQGERLFFGSRVTLLSTNTLQTDYQLTLTQISLRTETALAQKGKWVRLAAGECFVSRLFKRKLSKMPGCDLPADPGN
jgi:hypothetical protein